MIAALLLAFALQGGAGAAAPNDVLATDPTVMIVEFPRGARFVGFPRRCPGSTSDDERENALCLAELYQGWATVVRHLSGPRVGRRELLRLTAHARRWQAGARMLVLTRPFEDQGTRGNFALWWHTPDDGDDYCMTVEDLATWGDNAVTRQFARGYSHRFRPPSYVERDNFHCIRG